MALLKSKINCNEVSSIQHLFHPRIQQRQKNIEWVGLPEIESLLLEGLESGEPVEATDDWWEQKRTQLVERFQQSDS
jgi:antitoxin ParD1/3/4